MTTTATEGPAPPKKARDRAPVPMQWLNVPQQERSQKTLERLLDAAEDVIRDKGLSGLTIPAVVKKAGSSVGSFYARFADKEALLSTLHERACAQTLATADLALDPARWEGAETAEMIEATVAFAVTIFGSRRTIMNAFNQVFAADTTFRARRARTAVELVKRVITLFMTRSEQIGHPDPEQAIAMAMRAISAVLEQRNALEGAGVEEVEIADQTLIAELVRMVKGYLILA